ncbi:hypothetical protein O181_009215 [Austropuccinia psidii MF-1]|uniref:Globin-sensor domain-containing protein n=1 Tax=Austropuccinia psidii MF-1 TaxID=1389203 RepID=A0A9Q3BRG8_9BASI|nr:hypothetical protein [Austropuccinia psidii MF-1]
MDPETVTRSALASDLESRVRYMKDFLDFTAEDCQIMKEIKPIAKPLVPEIVASAYNKLLSYACCRMAFFPRKDGSQGTHSTCEDLIRSTSHLSLDSTHIKLRRNILEKWIMKICTADYQQLEIFEFFDKVGIQHTGGERVFTEKKSPVYVDYIHLAMVLGYITDKMTGAILALPTLTWPMEKKTRAVRALHKIAWMHNDLLARHHMEEAREESPDIPKSPDEVFTPHNRKAYYNNVFVNQSSNAKTTPYPIHIKDGPFQSSLIRVDEAATKEVAPSPFYTQPHSRFSLDTSSLSSEGGSISMKESSIENSPKPDPVYFTRKKKPSQKSLKVSLDVETCNFLP